MAERKNRSVVEAARAMLEEKSLPKFYWAEAVRTTVYISEPDRRQSVGTRVVLRNEAELVTLEGVR